MALIHLEGGWLQVVTIGNTIAVHLAAILTVTVVCLLGEEVLLVLLRQLEGGRDKVAVAKYTNNSGLIPRSIPETAPGSHAAENGRHHLLNDFRSMLGITRVLVGVMHRVHVKLLLVLEEMLLRLFRRALR